MLLTQLDNKVETIIVGAVCRTTRLQHCCVRIIKLIPMKKIMSRTVCSELLTAGLSGFVSFQEQVVYCNSSKQN